MKKMMILAAFVLTCALAIGAFADQEAALELRFDANATTGYEWTAFLLSGDSVELPADGRGDYIPGSAEAGAVGVGGETVFTLKGVKPGFSLIRFVYGRAWESEIAEQRVYLAYVNEDGQLSCEEVTEQGVIEGVATSVSADEHSILLITETLGEVIALFPEDMPLPVEEESIVIYTNGTMTMSLPGMVNVLAWESVPSGLAREGRLPTFGELTGFDAFAGLLTEQNPVVRAYYEDGTEMDIRFTTEEPEEIQALMDAVAQLEIAAVSEVSVTDCYPLLRLTAENGEEWSVGFTGHCLTQKRVDYQLSNDQPFWKLVSSLMDQYAEEE